MSTTSIVKFVAGEARLCYFQIRKIEIDRGDSLVKYAVTHGGWPHADDLLFMSFIARRGVELIRRRDPTPEELDDPSVIVFDVGQRHEHHLKNYDHHQLDTEECAFTLYLKHLDLYSQYNQFVWLQGLERVDSKGLTYAAESIGVGPEDILPFYANPFESCIKNMVGSRKKIEKGDGIWERLYEIGDYMKAELKYFKRRKQKFAEGEFSKFKGFDIYLTDGSGGHLAQLFAETKQWPQVSICRNIKSEGYVLRRFQPWIDFNRCTDKSITWTHRSGFLMNTTDWQAALSSYRHRSRLTRSINRFGRWLSRIG